MPFVKAILSTRLDIPAPWRLPPPRLPATTGYCSPRKDRPGKGLLEGRRLGPHLAHVASLWCVTGLAPTPGSHRTEVCPTVNPSLPFRIFLVSDTLPAFSRFIISHDRPHWPKRRFKATQPPFYRWENSGFPTLRDLPEVMQTMTVKHTWGNSAFTVSGLRRSSGPPPGQLSNCPCVYVCVRVFSECYRTPGQSRRGQKPSEKII